MTWYPACRPRIRRVGIVCARLAALVALVSLVAAAYLSVDQIRAAVRLVPPPLAMGIPVWSLDHGMAAPHPPPTQPVCEIRAVVTGYSSAVAQTDSTPWVTAANTRVRRGIVALSRDLLREFTPGAPFGFGDLVEIRGAGTFVIEDTMSRRHRRRADIWFESEAEAIRWGRQHRTLVKLLEPADPDRRGETPAAGRRPAFAEYEFDAPPIFQAAFSD